jgi:hypothetical protein
MSKKAQNLLSVWALAGLTSIALSHHADAAAELASHRAFYSVVMAPDATSAAVAGVDGVMTMSLERTCDGWIFTQDLSTIIALHDGESVKQTALFTSWESLDGTTYRFASRFAVGDGQQVVRGRASVNEAGEGTAHYSEPAKSLVDLPKGTLFPVSHTAWIIDEAEQGNRNASRVVFTGSEELEPDHVNAFIGNGVEAGAHPYSDAGDLSARKGWPLTMAFHSLSDQSGVPSFEMWAFQLDNGVAPSLRMDFGDFSTIMTAERLDHIDLPVCD